MLNQTTRLQNIARELITLPVETEWVEFKRSNSNKEKLGENISAIANSATLHDKEKGYILFGVNNTNHAIVGTSFSLKKSKVGNQEIENWLVTQLNPQINFSAHEFLLDEKPMVLIEVNPALGYPVKFRKQAYIRIGSYTKPLSNHPEKERDLWLKLTMRKFETELALLQLTKDDVLDLLDYESLYKKMDYPTTRDANQIISKLVEDRLVIKYEGQLAITNLGAVLFAKDITKFDGIKRKLVRVVIYAGNNKLKTKLEQRDVRGYASGIDGLINYIMEKLPSKEELRGASLKIVPAYPKLAIREIVANALIHQDFSVTGASPMIEIYNNRIEVSNPGVPSFDIERIIDHSPQSKNEILAGFMARMNICEERGSGVDKVVLQCELHQLPAPMFTVEKDFMKVTLFPKRTLREMSREDKVRATYYHAVIKYLSDGYMTNSSLRERFGIPERNYPTASKIIKLALDAGVIKNKDSGSSDKKYVPFWA
ncbi:MAG: putative DNA binding domain-containing protein [Candidatus Nomurabacteria bacterium]|jgi:predicted HTH transcriptional regulator|nr:putative DNA binding domain-containing protein [Candidatus Nomurabacteria bacterium]